MNVEVTIKGDVERLHLGPDDMLVFKVEGPRSHWDMKEIVDALDRVMSGMGIARTRWMVTSDNVAVSVVANALPKLRKLHAFVPGTVVDACYYTEATMCRMPPAHPVHVVLHET